VSAIIRASGWGAGCTCPFRRSTGDFLCPDAQRRGASPFCFPFRKTKRDAYSAVL